MPTTEYGVDQFFSNSGTSPKMVWDVNGVLGWSPHNMCLQSQAFEQTTPWNPTTAVTFTANAIAAPDGTMTADKMVETAIASNHQVLHANITTIIGATYTFSAYLKAAERTWTALTKLNEAPSDWFDLANGVVGTSSQGGAITSVGNGWYRCSITWIAASATHGPAIFNRQSNGQVGTYTGDGVSGIYVWGAQLNRGFVALPYLPTTTAARYGLALDYDPVTHAPLGLLCEPAATNLVLRSQEFNTTWFKSNITIGVDSTAAPDGSVTADKIIDDTVNSNHSVYIGTTLTAAAYTFSVYLKAAERSWAALGLFTGALPYAYFNLTSGTIGTVSGGATAAIVSVGNGWYRCSITMTATAATWYSLIFTAPSDNVYNYVGNGTGIYAWGAQLELGTVATSPIPTFTASATRAADQYNITPASINYSSTAGSWWVEHYQIGGVGTNPRIILYNSAAFLYTTETTIYGLSDGTILSKSGAPTATGNTQKVACAFQSGDRALTAAGLVAATDAGSTALLLAPGASIIFGGTGGTVMRGYFRKLRYVPRRKTNAELVTETT